LNDRNATDARNNFLILLADYSELMFRKGQREFL
jgi:hypothetical protein